VTRRVVVSGMAGISPVGSSWDVVLERLQSGSSAIEVMEDWRVYEGLDTALGARVHDFDVPDHYTRKRRRSMGRVALMAVRAAELALNDAGLLDDPIIKQGRMGVSFGSSSGSPPALVEFARMLVDQSTQGLTATSYIRMMGHTTAVNIGVFFGLTGRVISTSTACTSGSQGIGYAYEAIRSGKQDIMIAGGAEELCASQAAVFDTLYATSTCNDAPETTPRPFDVNRDGLVLGEGAGAFILEEHDQALARGATIYAEIVGYETNADGQHVTRPNRETMARCIQGALDDAELSADAIGYVNGHGTATEFGDIAESNATADVMGAVTPFSTLKSYMGHTLGACGALEAWMTIEMLRSKWFAPTINLSEIDARCGELDYIVDGGREIDTEYVMSNNFAFGGINTSLIFRKYT
jgi:3-oxoacyl-[acyl-carrier-protein] synthase II